AERRLVLGEAPAKLARDDLRARVEVTRAAVVTEPGPALEDPLERRVREGLDRREALEEALEVRHHGGDRRLLEHDLADPDRVGVTPATPRQVAFVRKEPAREAGADGPGRAPGGALHGVGSGGGGGSKPNATSRSWS